MDNKNLPVLAPDSAGQTLPVLHQPGAGQFSVPLRSDAVHLLEYWKIIRKRKWLILLCFAITAVTVYIANLRMVPIYKATGTIQIDAGQFNVMPTRDTMERTDYYMGLDEFMQTQYKILQSRSLGDRVIRTLNLEKHPQFARPAPARASTPGAPPAPSAPAPVNPGSQAYSPIVGAFLGGLEIEPVRDTQLVRINYNSPDPELAAKVINTLIVEYVRQDVDFRVQSAQQATEFLDKQLTQLKGNLERAEEKLVQYARQYNINTMGENQEDVASSQLMDYSKALTDAQAERMRAESVWNTVRTLNAKDNFPVLLRNPLIDDLEKRLSMLHQEHAKLSAKFKAEYPGVQELKKQIDNTETQLEAEKRRALVAAETAYRTAIAREQLLLGTFERQKTSVSTVKENYIPYNILKAEVDKYREMYNLMATRRQEALVAASLKSSNIRTVEIAEVPKSPDRPRKTTNLMLGMLVGLLVGIGLAFFVEYLDNTVKTPEDVEHLTALPSLGLIPALGSVQHRYHSSTATKSLATLGTSRNGKRLETITHDDPTSPISEAYRTLRTSILLSHSDAPPKSFMFTSARPGEGKTTASINTGISFAQAGKRVVVVDLDMRKPRIHKIFNADNTTGISNYLAGNSDLAPLIQQTHIDNLFIIPAGPVPPNPSELLTSSRMGHCMELLDEYFEHIVIDTPPMLSVTDSRILSRLTDGVILVIRSAETPKPVLVEAQRSLRMVNAPILGVLVNAADLMSADYYYYSKYYYSYYYSYGPSGKKKTSKRKKQSQEA